jgi:uncharacterized membrane protein YraQ (UPF0718 family)
MTRRGKDFVNGFGGWVFLAAVMGLYVVAGLYSSATVGEALTRLGSLTARILPVILLVFGLLFVFNLLFKRAWLFRHLGRAKGVGAWAAAVICGVLSAGPIYAWYPLLGELREKDLSSGLIATFLYSRALKLPLLPLMVHYFGLAYTFTLSAGIIVFSVVSGLLMTKFYDARLSNHMEGLRK